MFRAEQNKVFQDANLSLIDIRKREIDYFTTFFSIFSTQCFLLTTFLAIAVSQLPPDPVVADGICGIDCPLYVMLPFAVFQASSIAFNALIILISTFVVVFGNWLAIHGREGAMIHAINGMIAEQNKVVRLFILAVICYQAQIFCTFFVLMDQMFAWICAGILVFFAIWTYRSVVRIYNTFKWDEVEAGWNYDDLKKRMESDDKEISWLFAELTPELLLEIVNELTGKVTQLEEKKEKTDGDNEKHEENNTNNDQTASTKTGEEQQSTKFEDLGHSTKEGKYEKVQNPDDPTRESIRLTTAPESIRLTTRDSVRLTNRDTFRESTMRDTTIRNSEYQQPRVTISLPSSKSQSHPIIPHDEIDPDEINKTYKLALRKEILEKTDSNEVKKEVILKIIRDKWKKNQTRSSASGKRSGLGIRLSSSTFSPSEMRNSFRKSVMESFSLINPNRESRDSSNVRPSQNFFQQALPDLPDIRASITSAVADLPRMSLQLPGISDLPRASFNIRTSIGAIGTRLSAALNPFRPSQAELEKEREMNDFVTNTKHVALGELKVKIIPPKSSSYFSWFYSSSSKKKDESDTGKSGAGEEKVSGEESNEAGATEEVWMKYYFVLKGNLIFYYENEQVFVKNPSQPLNLKNPIDLNGYELKRPMSEAPVHPFPFSLRPLMSEDKKKKLWQFRCNDLTIYSHWTERIQEVLDEIHDRELAKEFM